MWLFPTGLGASVAASYSTAATSIADSNSALKRLARLSVEPLGT